MTIAQPWRCLLRICGLVAGSQACVGLAVALRLDRGCLLDFVVMRLWLLADRAIVVCGGLVRARPSTGSVHMSN